MSTRGVLLGILVVHDIAAVRSVFVGVVEAAVGVVLTVPGAQVVESGLRAVILVEMGPPYRQGLAEAVGVRHLGVASAG